MDNNNNKKFLTIILIIVLFYILLININKFYYKYPNKITFPDSQEFENLLNNIRFVGQWKAKNNNTLLNNDSGLIKFTFNKNLINYKKNLANTIYANMLFLDSKYFDENALKLQTFFVNEDKKINDFSLLKFSNNSTDSVNILRLYNTNLNRLYRCKLNINVNFNKEVFNNNQLDTNKLFSMEKSLYVNIKDISNCGINIDANLKYENQSHFGDIYYIIFVIIVSFINLYSSLKLIKKVSDNPNDCKSINIITVLVVCCLDIFLCFFHMILSIQNDNYTRGNNFLFLTPSFWYFIIFSLVDLNFLFSIWKNNNWTLFYNNISEFKRRFNIFHIKINFICIFFVIIFTKYYLNPYIILGLSFLLIPQIYQYAKNGMIFDMDYSYIICFCCFRLVIVIYFRLFKNNLLIIKPFYFWMITTIFILILSTLIIYSQSFFGPKYFIPKIFIKNRYDYFSINKKKLLKIENLANSNENEKVSFK